MTITVAPATLPEGQVGSAYSQTLTASGGTAPYSFAVTAGGLPAGLSLDGATGILSGTPTAAGSASFTVTATDSVPATGAQAYTLAVAAIAITPTSLPNPSKGTAYAQTLAASGGVAPYAFAVVSGALPAGLALDSATGILSGTPTAIGAASFTIRATDSGSATGDQAYAVSVSGSIYWFICTSSASPAAPPAVAASQAEFNRAVANAIAGMAKFRRQAGHLLARPVATPINNHLLCDGAEVGRTDFPQLFAAIGTEWGAGDGSTTFNLPNLAVTPLPVATAVPAQTITPVTVSTGGTVTAPSGDGETGGTFGGNFSSGGRAPPGGVLP